MEAGNILQAQSLFRALDSFQSGVSNKQGGKEKMTFTSKLIMLIFVFMLVGYILSIIGHNAATGITEINSAMNAVFSNGFFLIAFFLALAGAVKFADEVRRGELEAMDIFYLSLAVGGAIFLYGKQCSNAAIGCPWFQSLATIALPGVAVTIVEAEVMSIIWSVTVIAMGVAFGLRLEKKLPKIF